MRKATATIVASLLALAAVAPASAADGGSASGRVTWIGEGGDSPGLRTSQFRVYDNGPSYLDGGSYRFSREGVGSLELEIACVKVADDWAEFGGQVIEGTGTGMYHDGEWWLVSVRDAGGSGPDGDEIGMKSKASRYKACTAALNDEQFGRGGIIYGGNIRVKPAR